MGRISLGETLAVGDRRRVTAPLKIADAAAGLGVYSRIYIRFNPPNDGTPVEHATDDIGSVVSTGIGGAVHFDSPADFWTAGWWTWAYYAVGSAGTHRWPGDPDDHYAVRVAEDSID